MSDAGIQMIFAQMERELVLPRPVRIHDGLLYHYTDAFGLDGILRNGVVFATHSLFMNDRTELAEGRQLVLEVCAELEADTKKMTEEQRALVHDFRISFENPGVNDATRDIFIASFSEKGDDLGQWRAYGGQGSGYAIGTRFRPAQDATLPPEKLVGLLLRCEYGRAEASVAFKADLLSVLAKFERYGVTYHKETGVKELWTRGMVMVLRHLAQHWLSIKNENFRDEAEWRLMAIPATKRRQEQIKTRPLATRGTVPYVEVTLDPFKAPPLDVEQIIVGPTQDPVRGVLATRLLLESLGYAPADAERIVIASKIPFRG
jgi:Protein of unknown function (DUF2971)